MKNRAALLAGIIFLAALLCTGCRSSRDNNRNISSHSGINSVISDVLGVSSPGGR